MSNVPVTTSPPASQGTQVSVSASLLFNDTPVTINSQDITNLKKNGLVFSITNPVTMGSMATLVDWMNKTLHLPVTSADIQADIQQVPDPFFSPLDGLFNAVVTLTTLNINTKTKVYQAGATMTADPAHPINLLNILEIQSIGVMISSGATGSPSSP